VGDSVPVDVTGGAAAGNSRKAPAEIFTMAILALHKSVNANPIAVEVGRVRLYPSGWMGDRYGVAGTAADNTGKPSVKIRSVALFTGNKTYRQNPGSMEIIIAGQAPSGWMGDCGPSDVAVTTGAGLAGSTAVQVFAMALLAAFKAGHGNSQTVER
jgi:hypothetical protein